MTHDLRSPLASALTSAQLPLKFTDCELLAVHNHGTLIPAEERENLFRPYLRTQTAQASGKSGWGIGLSLVTGIVDAHAGVLKVGSYERDGTTFTVDLPLDVRTERPKLQ